MCHSSTISVGIGRRNRHLISTVSVDSWPSSASECTILTTVLQLLTKASIQHGPLNLCFVEPQIAANVNPLDWMNSQRRSDSNGTATSLRLPTGLKPADLSHLPWYIIQSCTLFQEPTNLWWLRKLTFFAVAWCKSRVIHWRERSMWPSTQAICQWQSHYQNARAIDGSRWWTRVSRCPTTSSPMMSRTEPRPSNCTPISWMPTCTPCLATPLLY